MAFLLLHNYTDFIEKIGDFFKKMDILISKQKMKIEILEKEKQSFLQKMFL